MEVKINKEIRNYTEKIYFGLSLRQFICSLIACVSAVAIYFITNKYFNKEIVSWLCIFVSAPFIALGFIKYNGLTFEQLIFAFIKTKILIPKKLKFESENIYYEILNNKEENKNDKITRKTKKERKR